jgi:hypothetical protein
MMANGLQSEHSRRRAGGRTATEPWPGLP